MNQPDIKHLQKEKSLQRCQTKQLQDTESWKTFREIRNTLRKSIKLVKYQASLKRPYLLSVKKNFGQL